MEDSTLQQSQDALAANEEGTEKRIEAWQPDQETPSETRKFRSGTGISQAAIAAAYGSDQEHADGDGRNSPLFVSNNSTSTESMSNGLISGTKMCKCGIAIVVPPVERRWEYRVFPDEPRVIEILEEIEGAGELQYLVTFENGHEAKVPNPKCFSEVIPRSTS